MEVFIIYHDADLDGIISREIIKYDLKKTKNIEVKEIGIDYNKKDVLLNNLDQISNKFVYIVDFSFEPEDMIKIIDKSKFVVWIDHHKSAIDKIKEWKDKTKKNNFLIVASSNEGAACLLSWKLTGFNHIPSTIKYFSDYDIFNLKDPKTLYFQYGARANIYNTNNLQHEMSLIFSDDKSLIKRYIDEGKIINKYLTYLTKENVNKIYEIEYEDMKALVLNGEKGSLSFSEYPNYKDFDFLVVINLNKNGYTISLYSENIDVSKLAEKYGGGGHKGASGFSSKTLPKEFLPQKK